MLSVRPATTIVSTAASLLLGVGLGAWLFGAPAPPRQAPAAPVRDGEATLAESTGGENADEISRLRGELAIERSMRAQLTAEIARLGSDSAGGEAASEGAPDPKARPAGGKRAEGAEAPPWFSEEALARLGLEPPEIERIRARWEQSVMDRLYLTHEGAREEGTAASQRERVQAFRQIRQSLREDLGDADFEAMLYATEQPNRVRFKAVLNDSPAAEAGVQEGDEVIRYDGQRIFGGGVLMTRTREGEAGEWVELEVLRAGERLRLFVRRGPLGVQLNAVRRTPYLE